MKHDNMKGITKIKPNKMVDKTKGGFKKVSKTSQTDTKGKKMMKKAMGGRM